MKWHFSISSVHISLNMWILLHCPYPPWSPYFSLKYAIGNYSYSVFQHCEAVLKKHMDSLVAGDDRLTLWSKLLSWAAIPHVEKQQQPSNPWRLRVELSHLHRCLYKTKKPKFKTVWSRRFSVYRQTRRHCSILTVGLNDLWMMPAYLQGDL